ncbi:auxin-responsive protein SAUR71 [Mangifera indica]|uniref:auxin-responsive protein SAUR71 n=1 Tax=Mangifera indica TaxID=29780 RepID=UPI001CFB94BB|nr:auxin-responsive protein SAUR71 [Mangifera indica]
MESKKSDKIRDIVKLLQILKKWRKLANSSKTSAINNNNNNNGTKSIKFLKRTLSLSDNPGSQASSNVVPKGYLAVCVGEELKRFIIPTQYLSHQAFHILLREAEEEFGFQQTGVLRIPCKVSVFQNIVKLMEEKKDTFSEKEGWFNMDDIKSYCSSECPLTPSHHPQNPMCR